MPHEIRTEIVIRAPSDRVWAALTDFASYPAWNPFVREARGEPVAGARLTVRLQRTASSTMTFRPRVLVANPPHELRWLGRLLVPGLFDGEHSFSVEDLPDGGVRFRQEESFRGLLVPLLWRTLDRETRPLFDRMNQALRALVEPAAP